MGLFQKRTSFSSTAPLYSLGMHKSLLVVGLGNPGKEYEGTRHNIGFAAVDAFATNQELPDFVDKKDLKVLESSGNIGGVRVILIKPTTFMNLSGEAVLAVQHFYKIEPESTLVIHDELDIPFGQIRLRQGGGSAGHNGLKSLIQHGNQNTWRARIGIGRPPEKIEAADYVLHKFSAEQQAHLSSITKEITSVISEFTTGQGLPIETREVIN